jgi:hypothetical protein
MDPVFEKFFADDFQRLLERTSIPGMGEASWDRRAAWLLYRMLHPSAPPTLEFGRQTPDEPFQDTGSVFD